MNEFGLTTLAEDAKALGLPELLERKFTKVKGTVDAHGKVHRTKQHRESSADKAEDRRRNKKRKSYLRKRSRSAKVQRRLAKHSQKIARALHRTKGAFRGAMSRAAGHAAHAEGQTQVGASVLEMRALAGAGAVDLNSKDTVVAFANIALVEGLLANHLGALGAAWDTNIFEEMEETLLGANDDAAIIAKGMTEALKRPNEKVDPSEIHEELLKHVALINACVEAMGELDTILAEECSECSEDEDADAADPLAEGEGEGEGEGEDDEGEDDEDDEDDEEGDEDEPGE